MGDAHFRYSPSRLDSRPEIGHWRKALRGAERELDAATTLRAVRVAAKTVMRAKAELKVLEDVPTESGRSGNGASRNGER